jgi:chemotaxis protein MotB
VHHPPPHWPSPLDLAGGIEQDAAEDKDSGWLISFADLLTLLLTLFVLLLAFNRPAPRPPARPAAAPSSAAFTLPPALRNQVEMTATAGEVNLLIKDDLLFDEGSTTLKPDSAPLLDRLAHLLAQNGYAVSVEGHTDDLPIHTDRFPSNWELSAARAGAVTRYFIEHGIAPSRLSAAGYADTRPIAANDSAADRARNRRVSLVVHLHSTPAKISGTFPSGG